MNSIAPTYENILRDMAEQVGLDAQELLQTEELMVDGLTIGLQLDGDEQEGDLVFFSVLGTPAAEQLPRIMRVLLEANHFWVGTSGCTLGMQQETGAVVLCGRIRIDELSGATLAALLDGFADTALFWKTYINTAPTDRPETLQIPAFALHQRA